MQFQATLFEPGPGRLEPERTPLSRGAWIDVQRSWLEEADEVFAALVRAVPWRAEQRQMYDRLVDVPRLTYTYMIGEELPHPALTAAREALGDHYEAELGERFRTAGCCDDRDGRDLVALARRTSAAASRTTRWWRSFGRRPPPAVQRPRGLGDSIAVQTGHGDLVVMGGSCERTGSTPFRGRLRRLPPLRSVRPSTSSER